MTRPLNSTGRAPGHSTHRPGKTGAGPQPATGLARALSKLGFCSRSQAWKVIQEGRVRVNGNLRRDPEFRVNLSRDKIVVDQESVQRAEHVYVMLNKPRGLVTSASDEQGRETVYACLQGLPFLGPVGRLDKASEGLLLLTNDTAWGACITDPARQIEKTYHVQVDCVAEKAFTERLEEGAIVDGQVLSARRVNVLRQGEKNSWLEIVLDEGKNRQIRRLIEASGQAVLRLVRVAIGDLHLGDLPKGQFRHLTKAEIETLRSGNR